MEVRPGAVSGESGRSYDLSFLDLLSGLDMKLLQVTISRRKSVTMVDADHPAVFRFGSGKGHVPIGGGDNRRPGGYADIKAPVRPASA